MTKEGRRGLKKKKKDLIRVWKFKASLKVLNSPK